MYATILALALQLIVSIFLIVWVKAKVRGHLDSGSEIDRMRREIGALMTEMEGSADRNVTILEDRIERMRELIAEADRRIELSARESTRRTAEAATRARPETRPEQRAEQRADSRPDARLDEQPAPASDMKPEQIPFITFSDKPLVIEAPFAEKAMELYRRGFSSDLIAARLGSTLSEVELALAIGRERNREDGSR